MKFHLLFLTLIFVAATLTENIAKKECLGTEFRFSRTSNLQNHYDALKKNFANCTHIKGNLELTWLEDPYLDTSFLQYITEVSGYVLIGHVKMKRLKLPNLKIIRGQKLFELRHREKFALAVMLNELSSLELPALREILHGTVGLISNPDLCYASTINWEDVLLQNTNVTVFNSSTSQQCPACHESCAAGCWGDGPQNCQILSKFNCNSRCNENRCFGLNENECCHRFCAGGCTGPKPDQCISCKHFIDDGVCVDECPPLKIYNSVTYTWDENPNGKYVYGDACVEKCPEYVFVEDGGCVSSCSLNKVPVNGECKHFDGLFSKTCKGDVVINSHNIDGFEGCTTIQGSISIYQTSLAGYQEIYRNYTFGERYLPIHPVRFKVFSDVKEISGFLLIQAHHPDFKDLSYFQNLEVIGGQTLSEFHSSLYITGTSLVSLNLRSLKTIKNGVVVIADNKDLCFVEKLNWNKLMQNVKHDNIIMNNSPTDCMESGAICDEQCNEDGCWGFGPDQCLTCLHFQVNNECINNCSVLTNFYQSHDGKCEKCDKECDVSCTGPGPRHCTTCKNVKNDFACVSRCPPAKYNEKGTCKPCHRNCIGGCTGPNNVMGVGGCNFCEKVVIDENGIVEMCLNNEEPCPNGFYYDFIQSRISAFCRKCHPNCELCTGRGVHESVCQKCKHYKNGHYCEEKCPENYYHNDDNNCIACDEECDTCNGQGPNNCKKCRHYKIYSGEYSSANSNFTCVRNCPFVAEELTQEDRSVNCISKCDCSEYEIN